MTTQITVRPAASDRQSLEFTKGPAIQLHGIRWVMRLRSYDLERIYPKDALRHELQAMVRVICQVQADHSVICGGATADDPVMLPLFEAAAYEVMSLLVAAEKKIDGSPAAGIVVTNEVEFKLAQ